MAAKALTGTGYDGHAFWDTETNPTWRESAANTGTTPALRLHPHPQGAHRYECCLVGGGDPVVDVESVRRVCSGRPPAASRGGRREEIELRITT